MVCIQEVKAKIALTNHLTATRVQKYGTTFYRMQ